VVGALVVAVDGVAAEQLEVDVPVAHRHARVVADPIARLAHCGVTRLPDGRRPESEDA